MFSCWAHIKYETDKKCWPSAITGCVPYLTTTKSLPPDWPRPFTCSPSRSKDHCSVCSRPGPLRSGEIAALPGQTWSLRTDHRPGPSFVQSEVQFRHFSSVWDEADASGRQSPAQRGSWTRSVWTWAQLLHVWVKGFYWMIFDFSVEN